MCYCSCELLLFFVNVFARVIRYLLLFLLFVICSLLFDMCSLLLSMLFVLVGVIVRVIVIDRCSVFVCFALLCGIVLVVARNSRVIIVLRLRCCSCSLSVVR